ncbi:MAG: hypothetical protein PHE67_00820 [Campylobacterales bacterium]|nr:hypothetical protein [Campylobacterales bacterium]
MVKKRLLSLIIIGVIFQGCSFWEAISIGKMNGKADEVGQNYEDTGLIADPYFLYKHRKELDERQIYPNSKCRKDCRNAYLIEGSANE